MRVLACLLLSAWTVAVAAQPGQFQFDANRVNFVTVRAFRIPFQVDPTERRVLRFELYAWSAELKRWEKRADAPPTQKGFAFSTSRDEALAFAVRTVYEGNVAFPPTLDALQPELRVTIDTVKPAVQLHALPGRPGVMGVDWVVREDHLDLKTFRLDYRPVEPANSAWQQLPLDEAPTAVGQQAWNFPQGQRIEVRLQVRDQAGNLGEDVIPLAPNSTGATASHQGHNAGNPATGGAGDRFIVNNRLIKLNGAISEVGPSGVSAVELWFTTNRQDWQKAPAPPPAASPAVPEGQTSGQTAVQFLAPGDGQYGFVILARSGVGKGEQPPRAGDDANVWVLVDTTPPVVKLTATTLGHGDQVRNLTIRWEASDDNFGSDPIYLEFSEQRTGPWQPIAGRLPNNGEFVWAVPDRKPYRFFVRVRAVDRANNPGEDTSKEQIIVDHYNPRVRITAVEGGPAK
jgi:hypothetical protein